MTGYSTSLRLWEGTPGDPAIKNAWGTALNTNDNLIEAAIIGTATVSVAGQSTYTLSTNNGAADQARPLLQVYTGALTGDCTVTVPNVPKIGYAQNNTTGGHNIILTAGAGTTATIPPGGAWYLWSSDGSTNASLVSLGFSGGLSVSSITTTGGATIGGALVGNSLSITTTGTIAGNVNLGGTLGVTGTMNGGVSMTGGATIAGGGTISGLTVPILPASGGLGVNTSAPANGQIPIGQGTTATAWGTITQGANVTITNGAGSIKIDASGVSNTAPIAATNSSASVGSLAVTTGTFTAPSAGKLMITARAGCNNNTYLNSISITASLAGLISGYAQTIYTAGDAVAWLPMTASQTTTLTATANANASTNIAVGVSAFFIQGA